MGYEASILAGVRLLQHFFKYNQDSFDSFEAFLHTRYSGISFDKTYMTVSRVHSVFYTHYLKINRCISGIGNISGFVNKKYRIINQLYEDLVILRLGW